MSDNPNDPSDDIVDGEVVGEFNDGTLIHLPKVEEEPDTPHHIPRPQFEERQERPNPGRRQFLTRLLLNGTAALMFGGSVALWVDSRRSRETTVVLPSGAEVDIDSLGDDTAGLVEQIGQLQYELALVTAERDQGITYLAAAQSRIQELEARVAQLESQCAQATELNDLWQALDETGLDFLVGFALGLLGPLFTAMVSVVALLRDGLETAEGTIGDFLEAIPSPRSGLQWLNTQAITLSERLDSLQARVQEAISSSGAFGALITEFIIWILDRLPFGAGNQARAAMDAMEVVLADLPSIVTGVSSRVLSPLLTWFSEDDQENLTGILISPIHTLVFGPADDLLTKAEELNQACLL
ncbi:MAG: hypothetical protein GYB68_14885, partial [Chloroflexi bacterium]|nr:hypothetical protein [Chloroflexota bacterium]